MFGEKPMLYNVCDNNYLNKIKKNECYAEICEELVKIKPDTTLKDIQNKIKTHRNQYNKEKSLVIRSKKSGAGADELYEPKLWCFNQLKFWDNTREEVPSFSSASCFLNQESAEQNVEIGEDALCSSESQDLFTSRSQSAASSSKSKKLQTLKKKAEEGLDFARKFYDQNTIIKTNPAVRALVNMVAADLSDVNQEIFLEAKWKILDALKVAVQKQARRNAENIQPTSVMSVPQQNYLSRFRTISSSSLTSSTSSSPPVIDSHPIQRFSDQRKLSRTQINPSSTSRESPYKKPTPVTLHQKPQQKLRTTVTNAATPDIPYAEDYIDFCDEYYIQEEYEGEEHQEQEEQNQTSNSNNDILYMAMEGIYEK